jgi:hypothetical protein
MQKPVPVLSFAAVRRAGLTALALARVHAFLFLAAATRVTYKATRQSFFNILWAVVFGFATLNILSLAAKRFEPTRRGFTFGELMAVGVVLISIFLLMWEMLGIFHMFPLKIRR